MARVDTEKLVEGRRDCVLLAAVLESVAVRAALGEGALDTDWDCDTLGVAE